MDNKGGCMLKAIGERDCVKYPKCRCRPEHYRYITNFHPLPLPPLSFYGYLPIFRAGQTALFWSSFASQPHGNVCYADYTVFSFASHDNSVTGERTRGALDKTRKQKAKQKAERENVTSG